MGRLLLTDSYSLMCLYLIPLRKILSWTQRKGEYKKIVEKFVTSVIIYLYPKPSLVEANLQKLEMLNFSSWHGSVALSCQSC